MSEQTNFKEESQFVQEYFNNINKLPLEQLKKYLITVRNKRRDESNQKLPTKEILNTIKEGNGKKAIHIAAARGDVEVFKYLVQKKGADIHALDNKSNNAFIIGVQHDNVNLIRFLIDEYHVDVNYQRDTVSALHLAAQNGSIGMIELLLSAGANINQLSMFGTPVSFAIAFNQNWAAQHLIEKGADLNISTPDMPSVLHLVIDQNNQELFNKIIGKVDVNQKDPQGWSALQLCAEKGLIYYIDPLINAGAEVDFEKDNKTALDLAAYNGKLDCLEKLREYSRRKEPINHQEEEIKQLSQEEQDKLFQETLEFKKQGNVHNQAQQYAQAEQFYKQAIECSQAIQLHYPQEIAPIYTNLANMLIKQQKYNEALAICKEARQVDEKWVKIYYFEGQAYEGLKEFGEAAASYFEALKIKHDDFFKKLFDSAISSGKKLLIK